MTTTRPPVRVTLDEPLHPDAARLLDAAIWGTDGVRYQAPGSSEKTASLPGQRLLHLYEGDQVRGIYALAEHTLIDDEGPIQAWYRNSLVVDPAAAGRGYGAMLVQAARDAVLGEEGPPAVVYGFIEAGNGRSLTLSRRAGYAPQWRFDALLWLRQWPRAVEGVAPVDSLGQRASFGDQVVAPDDTTLAAHATRYALMQDGRPIAAISAREHRWRLTDGGGPLVRGAARALPWLGLYGGLLRDGALPHLRVAGPVGPPAAVAMLIDHLLAAHGLHLAIAFLDVRDPQRAALRRLAGPTARLLGGASADVMLGARGISAARRAKWSTLPYVVPLAYPG